MNTTCTGIQPNPDIAGIGVRLSVYVQATLTILPLPWFLSHGHLNKKEQRFIRQGEFGLVLTTLAILITAFIQSSEAQLSVYDAVVVLNLAWINVASASVCFVFEQFTTDHDGRFSLHPWNLKMLKRDLSRWRDRMWKEHGWMKKVIYLAFSLNITLLGAFGLRFWTDVSKFGGMPECIPNIRVATFGISTPASNARLRIASLVIYAITLVPILNLALLILFITVAAELLLVCVLSFGLLVACAAISTGFVRDNRPTRKRMKYLSHLAIVIAAPLLLDSLFIADTERTIHLNQREIGNAENQWTFGQTLAMALIALPLSEVVKQLAKEFLPPPAADTQPALPLNNTHTSGERGLTHSKSATAGPSTS
jgi:hypothetical protein